MKKDMVKQVLCLIGMGVLLITLYFAGYHYGQNLEGNEIITTSEEDSVLEGDTEEELLDHDASYVLESHDLDSDEVTATEEKLPVEFIGLSKSDVIDYITSHKEQFQEEGEEVKNISMISYSHDTLVLRKDITESIAISETVHKYENENQYNYYMVLEEGYLVVYKQDKTTVYLETGIEEDTLDEAEREQLIRGIGVKNISELYRYLESYTS